MFLLKVGPSASFSKRGSSVRNPNTMQYKQAQNQIFLGQTCFFELFKKGWTKHTFNSPIFQNFPCHKLF